MTPDKIASPRSEKEKSESIAIPISFKFFSVFLKLPKISLS